MSSSNFHIKEHVVDASHIREFPRALKRRQEDVLKLAVKEYIPKDNPDPQPGDVTIIGAHANGFPKELYEPLWDELHAQTKAAGSSSGSRFRIRSIIIADAAWQGRSGVLNERLLGNDPAWHDYPRDILHLINLLRPPRPLIGVGHSFGGNALVNLSLMHPRLLSSLVLLDPVISRWSANANSSLASSPAAASAYRRDLWPSREAARAAFARSPFYQAWDPRVLEAWIEHGLRDTPTALYPAGEAEGRRVTLTTTRHQEVFTFFRPSWDAYAPDGKTLLHPEKVPDLDPALNESDFFTYPLYRAESPAATARLPNLRPGVLYVFGETSDLSLPELREEKMALTGSGVGGSGGKSKGRVKEYLVKGRGHLIPMEVPRECAEAAAAWIADDVEKFRAEQTEYEEWQKKSDEEKTTITDEWRRRLAKPQRKGQAKM